MGLVLEIGVQIRKFFIISKRACYTSVCNHPFLVGILLFLIFLHRSFPFVFSLLVSASPILVCTAVLLGTLLSFGQPNIPEIEKEEKLTHDIIASLRTGVSGDDTVVVERDGSFSTERFSGKSRDIVDTSVEEASYTEGRVSSEVEDRDGSVVYAPLVDEDLQHTLNEKREIEDVERELDSPELDSQKNIPDDKLGIEGIEWDVDAGEKQYTLAQKVQNEIRRVEDDTFPRESVYAHKGDHLYSFLGGSGGDDEAEEELDDEASDSESDRAESSSPDASMADILPMLDELHPLLDSEAPQPAYISHDESDAASDRSTRSNAGSVESDVETENRGGGGEVEEGGVEYNDGDEEEALGGKEDESKSAIKWTEDDQKNLMDLGNLELERNRRLENLIARRRARKSFKIMAEKNLIDFDSSDLPCNVAPISTTRHNPFDLPDDSFDNLGLPPIPGSAPSIMLPRRNPFDLPYESNEEKPDLKGDPFEQEFMAFHSKGAFFRRHESFSLGPSSLGHPKQEQRDFKWRPVFVPERLDSEGTSSSPFQRQLSEVSDSKLSSVPDTESVSSAADLDERKFSEHEFTKETEVMLNIYHTPDLVEHGNLPYEDLDSLEMEPAGKMDVQHDEREIKLGKLQNLEPSLSDTGDLATLVQHVNNEIHLKPEPVEEDNSSTSSLSSLSEVDEKISDEMEGGSTSLEAGIDIKDKEFVISPQPSIEVSELQFMSRVVNDNERKEPVYDSSPLPTERILSFTSICSDMQAEISEMVTTPASVEMHAPFVDQDSEVHGESTEEGSSGYVEISGATSKVHASDEIERSLGTINQLNLECSHSEENIYLPKNLDAQTGSSDSSYQPVFFQKQQPSEQEKVLSWSDKSMVEPYFDDHAEALIIKEEIDDVKEIDAGLLSELDTVGDFSVKEVGEPLHTDELIPEEANIASTKFGDLNLSESNQELPVLEARSIEDIDMAFKQIHKGLEVEEVLLPGMVDDLLEVEASENTAQTCSELPIVEARSQGHIVTALQQVSEGDVNELPQLLDPEGESTELPLEYVHTILKQVSEGGDNAGELPKPLYSEDVSEEVGSTAVGSTEEIASSNVVSNVQENITAHTALKEVTEIHADDLPKAISNSNDGSEEVGTDATGCIEEAASSTIISSVQENITTDPALKQISESHADELPKPTSNSNDGSEEVETNAVGSMEEIASSNIVSSVEENSTNHTDLTQVSESHVDELPKPASDSNDGSEEVESNAMGSTEEIASSNILSSVEENITTHTALTQISESHVDDELPKPASDSYDGSEEVESNAMGSTEDIASSNILSSVQENITTDTVLKQASEVHVYELPKLTSNSKEGLAEVEINAVAASTEEIASNTVEPVVQEIITSPTTLKQVSGSSQAGLTEVGPSATDILIENTRHEN